MLKQIPMVSTIVSCEWLFNHLHLEHLVILDAHVNSSSEIYLPNARRIDIKEKFSDPTAKFPNTIPSEKQFQEQAQQLGIHKTSVVVVYDDKGMYWSPRVWWLFKTFGFENVAVLDGGLPEWQRLKYKTVSKLNSNTWGLGNFEANYQPEKMQFFKDIIELSKDNNCVILDARSEDRFKGLVPEPRVGLRSGTIPNSKNLPYTNLLNGNCFKSKAQLAAIFESFNIGDKSVTFSCGSGITACILALAATISDYNKVAVYDGSWTEYGTLTP